MDVIAQRYEPAYPVEQLTEHPRNPRRGDVELVDESLTAHGFYGAVLVQESSGHIIVGNHRTRVARQQGAVTLPAFVVDVADEQARAIMLMDNRASDRATNDERVLAELLDELRSSAAGLLGTGYATTDLEQLLAQLDPEPLDPDALRDLTRSAEHSCPFCDARWVVTAQGPEQL